MTSLLLDTNILMQEGLSSRNMRILRRLVNASHVEIFIPEIVKKEFLSRRVSEAKQSLEKAKDSLSLVDKNILKDSDVHKKIKIAQAHIREAEVLIEESINNDFSLWKRDLSASILPFRTECMTDVINEYFAGASVYRKPKSREDIPDAIINKSIDALISEKQEITVAIKDGVFKNYLSRNENITIVDSLKEFLDLESNRNKLTELDSLSERISEITQYLSGNTFTAALLLYLTKSSNQIEEVYLEEHEISNKSELNIETFGERINFPQVDTVKNFMIESVDYLSKKFYSLEVSFEANAILYYCADYAEYMHIEEDTNRCVSIENMKSDGICDLSELFKFKFNGYVEIGLKEDLDINAIKLYSDCLSSEVNPIIVDLRIENAEII